MQCTWWWRTILAVVVWLQAASSTVELQPVTRLAGWQAHGSWVFNEARSVAAGTATNRNEIRVLSYQEGTWMLADVLTPPEAERASFRPGSVVLSGDGRLLAVAVTTTASQNKHKQQLLHQQQHVTVGYVYKVVAQPAAPHAFKYQLAAHLTVPAGDAGKSSSSSSSSNNNHNGQQAANFNLTSQLDMTADGQTILACWAQQGGNSASSGATTGVTAQGVQKQFLSTESSTRGAAVFRWTSFGKSAQAVQLMLPKGSTHLGACRLDHSGRVALVADALGGAMVYRQQAHAARRTPAAYLAAGWLAGAPAGHNYQILSADISPCGRQAVLLVRGVRPSTWRTSGEGFTALKVFAADSFGLWSEACNVHINDSEVKQGQVKLSAYPGGVHVWTSLAGRQVMYAIGLTGANSLDCPTSPILSSLTVTAPQQLPAAAWTKPPAGCPDPATHTASCIRAGKLTFSGDNVTYTAAE